MAKKANEAETKLAQLQQALLEQPGPLTLTIGIDRVTGKVSVGTSAQGEDLADLGRMVEALQQVHAALQKRFVTLQVQEQLAGQADTETLE